MVVMIDLCNVFDTVDYEMFSKKLQAMGVFNITSFHSYLIGRTLLVNVDSSKSYLADISCGVSHGSILGPLHFLYNVNDMSISITSDCKRLLYADNSITMFSRKHIKNSGKNSNRVVNGLSTTSFVYTLIKLNAFFLYQS